MAIAGKVAITLSRKNDGKWSADVTYDRLVAVTHNNNLYISRAQSTGIEPPNDTYWFLTLQGFGGDDVQALIDRLNEFGDLIQAIVDGTTQVGNAKTLDGHGAEYFAPLSYFAKRQLTKNVLYTEDEINAYYDNLHTDALNVSVYEDWISNSTNHSVLGSGQFYVWGARTSELYGWQKTVRYGDRLLQYERAIYNGVWSEWTQVFTTAGGTVNGDVVCYKESNSLLYIALKNALKQINVEVQQGGIFCLRDATNSKDIINSTADGTNTFNGVASGNVPLTGGKVTAETTPLEIVTTNTENQVRVKYLGASGLLGWLGFAGANNPVFYDTGATPKTLLHTGNKTTGTYTGNGDATSRTINTGGIGNALLIYDMGGSSNNFAIVTYHGAIVKNGTTLTALSREEVKCSDGVLTLKTTNGVLNNNTATYKYQVL